ncbi:MAG TPA: hypothetical protein PLZ56_08040, partial [Anaerolineae bacterium]|nr:hypothetical protein [Anaerolineae bacterium]
MWLAIDLQFGHLYVKESNSRLKADIELSTGREVIPVTQGIPWLGFVVFPMHRRLKRRNVINFRQRLRGRLDDCQAGRISFAELDACVKGWVNHVHYADTWGLQRHVFGAMAPIRGPRRGQGGSGMLGPHQRPPSHHTRRPQPSRCARSQQSERQF